MKMLRRSCEILGLAVALIFLRDSLARAEQVVLSDPLTSWPLNFGAQSAFTMMKDGALHIVEPQPYSSYVSYTGFTFKDMDASATVTATPHDAGDAGLLFWSDGLGDYYYFGISAAQGTFSVSHHTAQTGWTIIVGWTKDPSIKTGPAAANTLRVVTKGSAIQLFVNSTALGHLGVMAPAAGGAVGLLGEGSTTGPTDYAFSNLSVSQ
jgi:hypothetical protein